MGCRPTTRGWRSTLTWRGFLVASITEFPIPTADSGPTDITVGPDGNLWFTQHNGMIGRITPGGSITEFPLPDAASSPTAITTGPASTLWFIESSGDKIGRIAAG